MRRAAGEDGAADVRLVPRLRHQHHVARVDHGIGQVREALLRAQQRKRLRHRVELVAVAPGHPRDAGPAVGREALLEAVLAEGRVRQAVAQRLDGYRRRRGVVVPRPHVDHVHPLLDQAALDGGEVRERIAREGADTLAELDHR